MRDLQTLGLLLVLAWGAACNGPVLMIPGGELKGEVVTQPVEDWSFVEGSTMALETRPTDPYSVEVGFILRNGRLYIDPAEGRRWLQHIREDPRVRVRFDRKVYPLVAVRVEDAWELEGFPEDRIIYRLEARRDYR